MFSWKAPLVLTVSLLWLAASVPHVQAKAKKSDFESMYRIVPRGGNRRMLDEEDEIISFDGDLDRIQQLALEEAIRKTNALGISDAPSLAPSPAPSKSRLPSLAPSGSSKPSPSPSRGPSSTPSLSAMPSDVPSFVPSPAPSQSSMPSDTPSLVPSQQPSSSEPLATSGLNSTTLITCPVNDEVGAPRIVSYIVTWQYSVETVPIFNVPTVVDRLEQRLANEMVPLMLECWDPTVTFDFSVHALDQNPADTPSDSDQCTSDTSGLNCKVFDGEMRLFMPESEDANYVFYQARTIIKSIIDNPSFHDNVVGLLKSTYLGPPIVIQTSSNDGDGINSNEPGGGADEPTLGVTSLVLVAVGSAALIVFVGSVYYMRRDSTSSEAGGVDGNATQAAGSSVNDTTFPFLVSPRPPSPFSEMLPKAYEFNENMSILSGNMSILSGGVEGLEAVLEISDEISDEEAQSPVHTDASSIMVSEAGYTTDAEEEDEDISLSFDVPRSLYTKATESPDRVLLGARRRKESFETAFVKANESILDTSTVSGGGVHDDPMLVWTPSKSAAYDEEDDEDDLLLRLV